MYDECKNGAFCLMADRRTLTTKNVRVVCTQFVTDGVKAMIDVKCKKIGMTALSFVEICEHNYYL